MQQQKVNYGDQIRLFTKSPYLNNNGSGGYLGWIDCGKVFRHSTQPDKRGELLCVPPLGSMLPMLFHESVFTILRCKDHSGENDKARVDSSTVQYGDVVILQDQEGKVWNNKIGIGPTSVRGYIGPRMPQVSRSGEIELSFIKDDDSVEMCYGDCGVLIQVMHSHRYRQGFNQLVTLYRSSKSFVYGGYLCCDGYGHSTTFELHGTTAPKINRIVVDDEKKVTNNVGWGDEIEIQGCRSILKIELSDGGYVEAAVQDVLKSKTYFAMIKHAKRAARVELCASKVHTKDIINTGVKMSTGQYKIVASGGISLLLWYALVGTLPVGFVMVAIVLLLIILVNVKNGIVHPEISPLIPKSSGNLKLHIVAWEASPVERVAGIKPKSLVKVPKRFIVAEEGNYAAAKERFEKTVAWRAEHTLDTILEREPLYYNVIKKYYPQSVHHFDKLGHPVYIERIGLMNVKELMKHGITHASLFRHYQYTMEYVFTHVANFNCTCASCLPAETCKLLIILDIQGLGFRDVTSDLLEYIRNSLGSMQKHYPQRAYKVFLVNTPSWFHYTYKLITPILSQSTKSKVYLVPEAQVKPTLLEYIDAQFLPTFYGGTCTCSNNTKNQCMTSSPVLLQIDTFRTSLPFPAQSPSKSVP